MCWVLLPCVNCQENTSFTALIITPAVMVPLSIMNLQELLFHYSIMMQIMATIRCVCLLMSVPLGCACSCSILGYTFEWIHRSADCALDAQPHFSYIITWHNDVSPKLNYKPVIFILQFAPFSHPSFWRRKRKSCRFPWMVHCRNCRSSTSRTWSTWSRGCKPSIRKNGTKSISPTKKKPISASFSCNSRFVTLQFYFVFSCMCINTEGSIFWSP